MPHRHRTKAQLPRATHRPTVWNISYCLPVRKKCAFWHSSRSTKHPPAEGGGSPSQNASRGRGRPCVAIRHPLKRNRRRAKGGVCPSSPTRERRRPLGAELPQGCIAAPKTPPVSAANITDAKTNKTVSSREKPAQAGSI